MTVRQIVRQFCGLREVHSLPYGRRTSCENGHKLATVAQAGFKQSLSRPMHYLGLLTCLIFGSLYLPAHAAEANKSSPITVKSQTRKSPESVFSDGNACITQSNIACATIALANIPSLSPYAKLLQGCIALNEHRVDDAMLLLLPLQAEKNIIVEAKISLHQHLAMAFETLDDTLQAIEHLMQAKSVMATSALPDTQIKDAQIKIDAIHQKIWALLNKQEQSQLIAMRGDNTDNDLQGWIDLCLAAKNQDLATSIANWATTYPDHSAGTFAKTLTLNSHKTQSEISLPTDGSIALMLPLADAANVTKADAFKQGLQAALARHGLRNQIKIYANRSVDQENIAEQYTQAKNDGAAYFVAPDFIAPSFNKNLHDTGSATTLDTGNILNIGSFLNDEAQRIATFAASNAMQQVVIVTTDNETAKQMTNRFRAAWQAELGTSEQNDQTHVITLPHGITPNDTNLLDLKTQISAKNHDMILLAMSASEAHIVRPYLNISTPTLAFSSVNDITTPDASLNAVRFVDIPFLLPADNNTFAAYRNASANLNSSELLRWFALGIDTLQLLTASAQAKGNEVIIDGLTGTLTIDKASNVKRQLSVARFTFDGVELEK